MDPDSLVDKEVECCYMQGSRRGQVRVVTVKDAFVTKQQQQCLCVIEEDGSSRVYHFDSMHNIRVLRDAGTHTHTDIAAPFMTRFSASGSLPPFRSEPAHMPATPGALHADESGDERLDELTKTNRGGDAGLVTMDISRSDQMESSLGFHTYTEPAALHEAVPVTPMSAAGTQKTVIAGPSRSDPPSKQLDMLQEVLQREFADFKEFLIAVEETNAAAKEAKEQFIAQLCAENAALRDQLGLISTTVPSLFQPTLIMNQSDGFFKEALMTPHGSVKEALASMNSGSQDPYLFRGHAHTNALHKNNKPATNLTKSSDLQQMRKYGIDTKHVEEEKPHGAWQHFAAWVPAAANPLPPPGPWQPLSADAITNAKRQKQQNGQPVKHAWAESPGHAPPGNVPFPPGSPPSLMSAHNSYTAGSLDVVPKMEKSETMEQQKFTVLSVWEKKAEAKKSKAKSHSSGTPNGDQHSVEREVETANFDTFDSVIPSSEQKDPKVRCTVVTIHPNSRKRIAWDLSSLVMVVYDLAMIPMGLFALPDNLLFSFMDWTTRIFWTLDMGMSSFTAVILSDGRVIFNIKFILKRYAKTWLPLDIMIVGSDWLGFLAAGGVGFLGLGRASRAFRIVRVVRLLRVLKLANIMELITERMQSDKLIFLLSLLKLLLFVICFAHCTACIWWGIGDRDIDEPTWVKEVRYENKPVGSQYLISMHWSISQLTGGMDEVTPRNALERLFVVIVFVFAFFASAMIVSTITSKLTQMDLIRSSHSQKVSNLKKYLKQNGISSNLTLRVQRNVQHALSGELSEASVELLPIVAGPLQVELHLEMYSPALKVMPFFAKCAVESQQIFKKICHRAMCTLLVDEGYIVFAEGEGATSLYIVVKGLLEYYSEDQVSQVEEKSWVGEPVLWTNWWHHGTLCAMNEVKIDTVDARVFHDIVGKFYCSGQFDPCRYASEFVGQMNKAHEHDVHDLFCMGHSRQSTKAWNALLTKVSHHSL